MISDKTFKLLAISKLPRIGKSTINQLAKKPIDWSDSLEYILSKNLSSSLDDNDINDIVVWAKNIQKIAEKSGDYVVSQLDDIYPKLLKDTFDAPAFLFCRGNISLLNTKCIAIIGTRKPSVDGQTIANNITQWFTNNDWTIVSGLALGIDTIAHTSCLESSGKTIVVLGTHLNKVYPSENENLLNAILLKEGLIISEYAYDNKGFRSQFVERDRIQAGLSKAVILVQSDLTGGSMHASKAILKYKRFLIVANQSKKDISNKHPKIEANMFFINSNLDNLKKELNISDLDLNQVIKMMSKNEYCQVNERILNSDNIISKNENATFDF